MAKNELPLLQQELVFINKIKKKNYTRLSSTDECVVFFDMIKIYYKSWNFRIYKKKKNKIRVYKVINTLASVSNSNNLFAKFDL